MTGAPFELPLRCRCGYVRGVAREVSRSAGFRFACYCTDCQAFARFLKRPDVLDAAGGTDIFQMPPARVTFSVDAHALRCLHLNDSTKVLRWYAQCCRTPLANTAASPRFPVVGLIHSFMDTEVKGRSRDEVLGPPLCRIYERSAAGALPPTAPPSASFGAFAKRGAKVLGWRVRGLNWPNPFFDAATGAPLSAPPVVTPDEHVAI